MPIDRKIFGDNEPIEDEVREVWKINNPEVARHYRMIERMVSERKILVDSKKRHSLVPVLYNFYTSKFMFNEPTRSEASIVAGLCKAMIQPWNLINLSDNEIVEIIGNNPSKLARVKEVLSRFDTIPS